MVVFIVAIAWVLVFGEDTPTGTAVELLAGGHKKLGSESLMGLIIVSFASGIAPWPTLRDIRLFAATARRRVFASQEDHDEAIVKPRLTELQGLNEYNEQRLLEEGIEDIANLAMADIPRLMVSVRMGGVRILDWVDQALLITYANQDLDRLRALGIRTASGLVRAYLGPGAFPEDSPEVWATLKPNSPHLHDLDGEFQRRLYHYVIALWYHPNFRWIDWLRAQAVVAA